MRTWIGCLAGMVALALGGAVLAAVSQAEIEKSAQRLEGKLRAPCCTSANPISSHFSGEAARMRQEIRVMLAEGRTEREILDHYVERHGEQILALPDAQGFNLTAYLLPFALLLFGTVGTWMAVRRWQTKRPETADDGAAGDDVPSEIEPEYAARLRASLRELD